MEWAHPINLQEKNLENQQDKDGLLSVHGEKTRRKYGAFSAGRSAS